MKKGKSYKVVAALAHAVNEYLAGEKHVQALNLGEDLSQTIMEAKITQLCIACEAVLDEFDEEVALTPEAGG